MHPRDFDHVERTHFPKGRYILETLTPNGRHAWQRGWHEQGFQPHSDFLEDIISRCDALNENEQRALAKNFGHIFAQFFRVWDSVENRVVHPPSFEPILSESKTNEDSEES